MKTPTPQFWSIDESLIEACVAQSRQTPPGLEDRVFHVSVIALPGRARGAVYARGDVLARIGVRSWGSRFAMAASLGLVIVFAGTLLRPSPAWNEVEMWDVLATADPIEDDFFGIAYQVYSYDRDDLTSEWESVSGVEM